MMISHGQETAQIRRSIRLSITSQIQEANARKTLPGASSNDKTFVERQTSHAANYTWNESSRLASWEQECSAVTFICGRTPICNERESAHNSVESDWTIG